MNKRKKRLYIIREPLGGDSNIVIRKITKRSAKIIKLHNFLEENEQFDPKDRNQSRRLRMRMWSEFSRVILKNHQEIVCVDQFTDRMSYLAYIKVAKRNNYKVIIKSCRDNPNYCFWKCVCLGYKVSIQEIVDEHTKLRGISRV